MQVTNQSPLTVGAEMSHFPANQSLFVLVGGL
jgi:hypothetical protein